MKDLYISITGFVNLGQVERLVEVFEKTTKLPGMKLGVGCMTNFRIVHGQPSDWDEIFPRLDVLGSIMSCCRPGVMNTLHYADYTRTELLETITLATKASGTGLSAVQLDMTWPEPKEVIQFCERYPAIEVILQVGEKALGSIQNNPKELLARLKLYDQALDYILLDKSMGRGLGLDAVALEPFVAELQDHRPDLGIVVAGGLGPTSLHLIEPLITKYRDLSFCAQARLTRGGGQRDPLDLDLAEAYLTRLLAITNAK